MINYGGYAVSERNTWYQDLEPVAADEARYIVSEFGRHHIDIGGVPTEDGGVAFMYAEGQLLASEQYLEPLREVLSDRFDVVVAKRVIRDIVLLYVTKSGKYSDSGDIAAESDERSAEGNAGITGNEHFAFLELLGEIDARLGPGIVTPNHVMTVAPVAPCHRTSGDIRRPGTLSGDLSGHRWRQGQDLHRRHRAAPRCGGPLSMVAGRTRR
jgi:hypothetical protein